MLIYPCIAEHHVIIIAITRNIIIYSQAHNPHSFIKIDLENFWKAIPVFFFKKSLIPLYARVKNARL